MNSPYSNYVIEIKTPNIGAVSKNILHNLPTWGLIINRSLFQWTFPTHIEAYLHIRQASLTHVISLNVIPVKISIMFEKYERSYINYKPKLLFSLK